jgi:osmotically-inducible protein OsmY
MNLAGLPRTDCFLERHQVLHMPVETTLAERVEGAIVANPYFSSRELRFETADGRVVLSGNVGTYFQKQMAQEIVRRVEGVREIDNCLEVSWRPAASAEFGLQIAE